jgi:hypothetical protein
LEKSFILDLADPISNNTVGLFEGMDIVIHLAHDFGENMADMNIQATESIAESAEKAGVSKQIFFSSYSARPDAISEYGVIKYHLEQYFQERPYYCELDLLSATGMFLKFINAVRRSPICRCLTEAVSADNFDEQLCDVIHKIAMPSLRAMNLIYSILI